MFLQLRLANHVPSLAADLAVSTARVDELAAQLAALAEAKGAVEEAQAVLSAQLAALQVGLLLLWVPGAALWRSVSSAYLTFQLPGHQLIAALQVAAALRPNMPRPTVPITHPCRCSGGAVGGAL